MLFRDGNIKDNLYFFHCTCSYILTFKCDYVFLYISFKVPFSIPCLFSREGVLQTSHFILKTIQKNEYFGNWIWEESFEKARYRPLFLPENCSLRTSGKIHCPQVIGCFIACCCLVLTC